MEVSFPFCGLAAVQTEVAKGRAALWRVSSLGVNDAIPHFQSHASGNTRHIGQAASQRRQSKQPQVLADV